MALILAPANRGGAAVVRRCGLVVPAALRKLLRRLNRMPSALTAVRNLRRLLAPLALYFFILPYLLFYFSFSYSSQYAHRRLRITSTHSCLSTACIVWRTRSEDPRPDGQSIQSATMYLRLVDFRRRQCQPTCWCEPVSASATAHTKPPGPTWSCSSTACPGLIELKNAAVEGAPSGAPTPKLGRPTKLRFLRCFSTTAPWCERWACRPRIGFESRPTRSGSKLWPQQLMAKTGRPAATACAAWKR